MKLKQLSAGALSALVISGGLIAGTVVYAQTTSDSIVDKAADTLGIDADKLEEALKQAQLSEVDDMVAAGDIDQEEATNIKQRIESSDSVTGFGFRQKRAGGPVEILSDYLGMTRVELRTQFEAGKTPAEIITSAGKSVSEFKTLAINGITEKINQAVTDGKHTQAEADERISELSERVDDFLNKEHNPEDGERRGRRGMGL